MPDGPFLVSFLVSSPLGELNMVASALGLRSITFGATDEHAYPDDGLKVYYAARVLDSDSARPHLQHLEAAQKQLDEYFRGTRHSFALNLDLTASHPGDKRVGSPFRRRVWLALQEIPYGGTSSYGNLARAVSSPGAARAVGTACAKNPLPIVLPCHRVVRADGKMGNYTGGREIKAALLALEAKSLGAHSAEIR